MPVKLIVLVGPLQACATLWLKLVIYSVDYEFQSQLYHCYYMCSFLATVLISSVGKTWGIILSLAEWSRKVTRNHWVIDSLKFMLDKISFCQLTFDNYFIIVTICVHFKLLFSEDTRQSGKLGPLLFRWQNGHGKLLATMWVEILASIWLKLEGSLLKFSWELGVLDNVERGGNASIRLHQLVYWQTFSHKLECNWVSLN
jgi:hypothetical protein